MDHSLGIYLLVCHSRLERTLTTLEQFKEIQQSAFITVGEMAIPAIRYRLGPIAAQAITCNSIFARINGNKGINIMQHKRITNRTSWKQNRRIVNATLRKIAKKS